LTVFLMMAGWPTQDPNSRFTGCDLSDEAIAYARSRANNSALRNLRFEVRDLTTFDREASEAAYDLITAFDAIHNQARLITFLPEFTGVSNRKAFSLCKIFELQAASRKTGIILWGPSSTRSRACTA
jgi:cyclopropane fatty-acyl-phospholipid synthase-like methyltransferase